jgi:pyridoxamine 5'-phosphate oxidase family protein
VSIFTDKELAKLRGATLARIATVGADGQPHVVPLTYTVNEAEDAIDVGGFGFGSSKKWRDAGRDPKVTFLLDEASAGEAYGIELRCTAEVHETGGEHINPRFAGFDPQFLRLRPHRIVTWGVEVPSSESTAARGRDVSR